MWRTVRVLHMVQPRGSIDMCDLPSEEGVLRRPQHPDCAPSEIAKPPGPCMASLADPPANWRGVLAFLVSLDGAGPLPLLATYTNFIYELLLQPTWHFRLYVSGSKQ